MKPFNIFHVSGALYVSNKVWPERDLDLLRQLGIGAIVNLVEDHTYTLPPPMVCLDCGFIDGTHIPPASLRQIYTFIDLHRGRTNVLVHCSAGVSRSVGIVAGQLMRQNSSWTWEQALGVLNQKRAVWVSVETQESVLAYLGVRPAPPGEIQAMDAEALRRLQAEIGIRLEPVCAIGWDTRGCVVEDGRVVGLGLYALDLAALPQAALRLPNLRDLYMCDNHLESLPADIAQLSRLQTLNLSGNRLASIPGEIGELQHLQVFNAARSRLDALPQEIRKLHRLQRLYLHENRLANLPEGIGDLASLTELYLQNNRLLRLPAGLGSLPLLRQLAVNGNELRALPAGLCHLPRLTALSLAQNRLPALPDEVSALVEMDNLNVSSNHLEGLPERMVALKKLRRLNIALNPLAVLPAGLERWLEELNEGGAIVIR